VSAIPLDGSVLDKEKKDGGRGSLVVTGAVWDACEEVMGLKALGIAGVCVKKVESWRELVKDALEELREWGEEEGSDDEEANNDEGASEDVGEEDGEGKQEKTFSAQDIADSFFSTSNHIPSSDPQRIRPRLDTTLRRLRLLVLLYAALIKRRLKTLPSALDGSMVASVDGVLSQLKRIPEVVDELASAFYDLDPGEIDTRMRECFETGKQAAEKMERDWKGEKDEFTSWVSAFCFQTYSEYDEVT
jgi:hypothetical protein